MQPWEEAERRKHLNDARASFSSRILPLEDDELFTAAKLAERLMEDPGWQVLEELLAWRRSFLIESIVSVSEPMKYTRDAGMAQGLNQARFALHALVEFAAERRQRAEELLAEEESLV
jgi:hypothetical protein